LLNQHRAKILFGENGFTRENMESQRLRMQGLKHA